MKTAELRLKSVSELRELANQLRKELFQGRMALYSGQLKNPSQIRVRRRAIARIETLLGERSN